MVHTYEVLVDVREFLGHADMSCRAGTMRYEIDAESRSAVNGMARAQARTDFPSATEYDVRVTRLLR